MLYLISQLPDIHNGRIFYTELIKEADVKPRLHTCLLGQGICSFYTTSFDGVASRTQS